MKVIIEDFITAVCSMKFWIAVAVIAVICFCAKINDPFGISSTAVYRLLLEQSKEDLLKLGEEYSSYYVAVLFRGNFWFAVIVPMVAAIPYINQFSDEWLTGYYFMRMHRAGRRTFYAMEKVFSAALIGFVTVCVGVLLYTAIVMFAFPSYDSYHLEAGEGLIAMAFGKTPWRRFIYFIRALLHVGILGSIASVISLILVPLLQDCFLALTVPMMICYLSTHVENYYSMFLLQRYELNPPNAVNMLTLLIPSTYVDLENSFFMWFGISHYFWFAYLLGLLGVLSVIMICIVKKRGA
ncbi:MAG: hypothetical protein J1E62_05900 [Lachnospiraceae bacterium]|nr:hypothetical protein [Lachnospiraceae bacterium]